MAAVSSTYLWSLNSASKGMYHLLSTVQKLSNALNRLTAGPVPPQDVAYTLAQLPTSYPGCPCRETGLFQLPGVLLFLCGALLWAGISSYGVWWNEASAWQSCVISNAALFRLLEENNCGGTRNKQEHSNAWEADLLAGCSKMY